MMATAIHEDYEITDAPTIGTSLQLRATPVASIEEMRAAMALKDEEQILQACNGAVIKEWAYEFTIGGKAVIGISVTGAMEIARIRAEAGFPIRFPVVSADEVTRNGVPGIQCTVTSRDQRSGAEGLGLVFEPYTDERGRANMFADRKALSKAKRNAVLDLVPEQQIIALLKAAKDSAAGRVPRKPNAQETRRAVPARPASENLKPQNPYGDERGQADEPSAEELLEINELLKHPAVAQHREKIELRIKNNKMTHGDALTSIAALKRSIADASA